MSVAVGQLVRASAVSKTFQKGSRSVEALASVDLHLEAAEFVALVGPSGCGKSTLLRMIAGLLQPTRGEIEILGSRVKGPRRDVGMMLQTPTLFAWRNVIENVLLPIEIDHNPTASDIERAHSLIDLVGLGGFKRHLPRELSGGMQQRVALCRLLVTKPSLMLLDEPFGALDEFTRENLNHELARMVGDHTATVILVTHNIEEAMFLADRIVVLGGQPGKVRGHVNVEVSRPRTMADIRSPDNQDKIAEVRRLIGLE